VANIIYNEQFIRNVDAWVFKNDQTKAAYLKKQKANIPQMFRMYNGTLYRGMIVDPAFMYEMSTKGSIKFNVFSSWTKDERLAKKFATSAQFRTTSKTGIPILLKFRPPVNRIILDIESLIHFLGEDQLLILGMDEMSINSVVKEKEVLIDKQITVKNTSVFKL